MIYIASPFFDEASSEWVTRMENRLEELSQDYFSPRQHTVNFNNCSPVERVERINQIFASNVQYLDVSNNIHVNLNKCNGRVDIGTLWELGYWIGSRDGFDYENSSIEVPAEYESEIKSIIEELSSLKYTYDKDNKERVFISADYEINTKESLYLTGLDQLYKLVIIRDQYPEINFGQYNIVLIDDLPIRSMILLGWMYAKGITYRTTSFKGYGSNVMIASSSKGHINLPGVYDEKTVNRKID